MNMITITDRARAARLRCYEQSGLFRNSNPAFHNRLQRNVARYSKLIPDSISLQSDVIARFESKRTMACRGSLESLLLTQQEQAGKARNATQYPEQFAPGVAQAYRDAAVRTGKLIKVLEYTDAEIAQGYANDEPRL